jgi:hypothetical protein
MWNYQSTWLFFKFTLLSLWKPRWLLITTNSNISLLWFRLFHWQCSLCFFRAVLCITLTSYKITFYSTYKAIWLLLFRLTLWWTYYLGFLLVTSTTITLWFIFSSTVIIVYILNIYLIPLSHFTFMKYLRWTST